MEEFVIEVKHLQKKYQDFTAVQEINLNVKKGEIFGIVGPNGAGKTTTVECLEGLRKASSGKLNILGLDPWKQKNTLKQRIGIQLQESLLPDRIKVKEALQLFANLYSSKADIDSLLADLDLSEKANAYFDALSGGQKQRLSIAMALVNEPEIVFFDELTTGLDPQARRSIWDLVEKIRDEGRTVVLVTHFMEEAERLCDRIAIIDAGKVIAEGSPKQLIDSLKRDITIEFQTESNIQEQLEQLSYVSACKQKENTVTMGISSVKGMADLIYYLDKQEIEFEAFDMHKANLDDVFIQYTGKAIRD